MDHTKPRLGFAFCLWLVLSATIAQAQTAERYEVAALRNVMVAVRDGAKLATDVYLPARNGVVTNGRFPAIVERTPYNKNDVSFALIEYFVARGYVIVLQDVRGRYGSGAL